MKPHQLFSISRPVFWFIPVIIFLISFYLAGAEYTPIAIALLFLLTFPFNFILYGLNDIYDYESDKRNARKDALSPKLHDDVFTLSKIFAGIIIITSFLTFNIATILSTITLILIAVIYSVPPLRLKERPPLDSLSNGAAFLAIWFLAASFNNAHVPLTIYFVSLTVVAAHMFTTIPDYQADKKANHKTFATVYGTRAAAFVSSLLLFIVFFFSGITSSLLRYGILAAAVVYFLSGIINKQKASYIIAMLAYLAFVIIASLFFIQQIYIGNSTGL